MRSSRGRCSGSGWRAALARAGAAAAGSFLFAGAVLSDQVFQAGFELLDLAVDLFGLAAEVHALELGDLQLELLDFQGADIECLLQRRHRAAQLLHFAVALQQQRLEGGDIVGERGGVKRSGVRAKPGEADRSSLLLKCAGIVVSVNDACLYNQTHDHLPRRCDTRQITAIMPNRKECRRMLHQVISPGFARTPLRWMDSELAVIW